MWRFLELDATAHPEDKPAPLFANKIRQKENIALSDTTMTDLHTVTEEGTALDQGAQHSLPYEPDIDGTPVVGDLLKMKFVEHRVVPTILVRSPSA
jgi:SIT4-associating protein SAP185/190